MGTYLPYKFFEGVLGQGVKGSFIKSLKGQPIWDFFPASRFRL
jgi:hypothetical protein